MRSVLITGTSTGIGEATTKVLAARGWRVFATMRDLSKRVALEQALNEIGLRDRVDFEQLDVTEPNSIRNALAAVLLRTGNRLDAVVHNAGVAAGGAFEDLPQDTVRRVMETNFFGILELTRQLLPIFRLQKKGRIVIVSSEVVFNPQPANSIYCASKWALEGWADSLTYELKPFGIDILLIEPGPCRTRIWESSPRFMPATSPYRAWMQHVSEAGGRFVDNVAGEPHDVAKVIATALEARRPSFRYSVGPLARLNHALHGKVPARLKHRVVAWYLGLFQFRS